MDPIDICVVHQQDGTDVRVGKVCRTLSRGSRVAYLGLARGDDAPAEPDLGGATVRLYSDGALRYGQAAALRRLRFILWVTRQLISMRPRTVVAVNEELGLPIALLGRVAGFRAVIDIHDPLLDRSRHPPLRPLLRFLQTAARRLAHALIVTDENRRSRLAARDRARAVVVPNYPNQPDFALFGRPDAIQDRRVNIAVIGSMHESRGLGILRRAVEQVGEVQVVAAGWMGDQAAREFCALDWVDYRGVLGMQESLHLQSGCDAILCYYDPRIENNRNASPNKLYEALCLGKRLIINREAKVSAWVEQHDLGYTCPYADVAGLAAVLSHIREHLAEHRGANPRLLDFSARRFVWEAVEQDLIAVCTPPDPQS